MLRVYTQGGSRPVRASAPYNLRYVQCPPRKEALRACRCAGCLIAMTDEINSGPVSRARVYLLSVLQPSESRSLLAV
jgi:hypothetical protein